MRKVVATDPERMWAEDADVLTSKLEPGFMLQARYLVITPRARLQASATLAMAVLTMATLTMALLTMAIPTARRILQGSASVSPDYLDANTPRYEAFEFKSEVV